MNLRLSTPALAVAAFISLCGNPSTALAETTVRAEVDRTTATIGDPITLTITLETDPGSGALLPDLGDDALGQWTVLAAPPATESLIDGVTRRSRTLVLTSFDLGEHEVPSLTAIGADAKTSPISLTFVSVGLDEDGELRNVKAPAAAPRNWPRVLIPWAAVLVLAILIVWIIYRIKTRPAAIDPTLAAVDLRPAHEIAEKELADLLVRWEAGGDSDPDRRQYFYDISQIVRAYIRNRYGLPATERTTREIMNEIKVERIAPETIGRLRTLLTDCDRVKYAADSSLEERFVEYVEASHAFVHETREHRSQPGSSEEAA
ncbi:MAG: hypothetical protein HKN20_03445 [Gemmatimonadetes bacterium]|nr:hypothetical protein [Gemmatimonadota bacterium]